MKRSLNFVLLGLGSAAALALSQTHAIADKPLHEKETAAAWEAFEKGRFQEAIDHAEICVREFRGDARRKQQALDGKTFPIGVIEPAQKEAIFKNGTLNDVATSYYIIGRAADRLGRKEIAVKALAEATKFPAARTWDERGWFWSPAEAAQLYLTNPELVDKAPHEIYTAKAWEAFNRGLHEQAILYAGKCVDQFHVGATGLQQELMQRKERLPDGAVPEAAKKRIFENGVLNDVATCLFIKGRAAERIGDMKTAASAYRQCTKLTYGRCWDPNGWFWTPALACSDRLESLP